MIASSEIKYTSIDSPPSYCFGGFDVAGVGDRTYMTIYRGNGQIVGHYVKKCGEWKPAKLATVECSNVARL